MARREITQYFDDLDNSPLSGEDHHEIHFSVDHKDYILDLSAAHAQAFREALAPYLAAAREETLNRWELVPPAAIREWARSAGISIAHRGKIPSHVLQAYADAHSEED